MTTITIHIDNEQNAELLEKMLKELSFVADIEVKHNNLNIVEEPAGTYQKIKRAIDQADEKVMFNDIDNPTKWQSDLRNEW